MGESAVDGVGRVQPRLTVLDSAQIERVHHDSLQILSSVGVRVDSERARDLFAKAAGSASVDGDRVYIRNELVEWALEVAPQELTVYDRRGELAFRLPGEARFGIGVTALYCQDPETDSVEPFARKHMEVMARLGGALPGFDVISTVGIVQDVPPALSDLYGTLEMVANTTKPLVLLVSDEKVFAKVLDLVEHLQGDLAAWPFVLPYFNPISPLVMNKGTIDKMWQAIERGLPFLYSNYGMAGASAPITPAGALVMLNAELLAGLTLSQLISEGSRAVLGSLPAFFDMKGMGSFYDPQSYLVDLACAEMMAQYRLPHCGTSGSGMGWGADLISGGHQWFNHLVSCIGKVGLAPFVGDNLGSKVFSPSIVVYANEIIEQVRLFAQGFALDDSTVGLDELVAVGPGGNFLTSPLTLELFRRAYYESDIFPRLTLESWQALGTPTAEGILRNHMQELLSGLEAPEDHAELKARGMAFISEWG
jgi:trimethylamine--corrinoid protein Co-methyltransferase